MCPRGRSGRLHRGPRRERVVAMGSLFSVKFLSLLYGTGTKGRAHEFPVFAGVFFISMRAICRCCEVSSCNSGFLDVFVSVDGWDSLGGRAVCDTYVEVDVGRGVCVVPVDKFGFIERFGFAVAIAFGV